MRNEPMVFDDAVPIEVAVAIGQKNYTLVEATAAAYKAWRNAQMKATKFEGGKPSGVGDIADSEPVLVSHCLLDEVRKPVPLEVILSWRHSVVSKLFDRIKQISGLDQEDASKNGQPSTTTSTSSPAS